MSAVKYKASHESHKISLVWHDEHRDYPALWLWEVDNVLIEKADNEYAQFTKEYSRTIGGPSFFVSVYETQFYHFLVDGLAQFLWLKTFIPDLKMYFVNDQPGTITSVDSLSKDFVRNIIEWVAEEGYGGEIINLVHYKKFMADKVFMMANSNITFLRKDLNINADEEIKSLVRIPNSLRHKNVMGDIANNPGAKPLFLPPLKEFLFKKALEHNRLPADFNYPKRVFLRPGLTFERLQAWKDQFDYLKKNGVVLDKEFNVIEDPNNAIEAVKSLSWEHGIIISDHVGSVLQNMREVHDRWLSVKEIEILDDFFKRKDYEFLDSQNMAWIDILNMVIRAEKVALLAGAAILNAMVAGDETQIIYIDSNTFYDFDHRSTLELFFVNDPKPIIYYDKEHVAQKRYSIERLLRDLEKEKGDYL